jgi:hypothetical protein
MLKRVLLLDELVTNSYAISRQLTGVVTSTMEWIDVLTNLFSTEVSGVDVVLATETVSYTYYIQHGQANLK